jgi:uncharacterized phiE125 gp8 family phage protein
VSSVTEIRMIDAAGLPTILPSDCCILQSGCDPLSLVFVQMLPAPARTFAGIEIDIVAGFGASGADVPEPFRQAIRLLIADWYVNRGDIHMSSGGIILPQAAAAILSPWRRARLI